jgi:hypothetical protein
MTIETIFFATRTLAREAATTLNAKVKDFGSTAPKGERWAVVSEPYIVLPADASDEQIAEAQQTLADLHHDVSPQEAKATLNRPGTIIGEQVLKTPNNKSVRVSWRRSMTAVRLAQHLQKVS